MCLDCATKLILLIWLFISKWSVLNTNVSWNWFSIFSLDLFTAVIMKICKEQSGHFTILTANWRIKLYSRFNLDRLVIISYHLLIKKDFSVRWFWSFITFMYMIILINEIGFDFFLSLMRKWQKMHKEKSSFGGINALARKKNDMINA